jgi:energy-coupling factor transporter ATP-binding protein EcfA2
MPIASGSRRSMMDPYRVKAGSLSTLRIPIDAGSCVLGRRGSGKTELVKFLAQELPYNLGILDVVGNLAPLKKLGKPMFGVEAKIGLAGGYRLIDYRLIDPQDQEAISEAVNAWMEKGHVLALFDEADRYSYFAASKTPLSHFINLARNYGCGYIATARRTANISPDFLANATYLFVFRHIHPKDLEVLGDWLEVDIEIIRHLEDHQFLVFRDGDPLFKAKLKL